MTRHVWVSILPSRIKNTLVTRAEQSTQCHRLAAKAHVSLSPIWSGRLLSGANLSLGHDGSSKPTVQGMDLRPASECEGELGTASPAIFYPSVKW